MAYYQFFTSLVLGFGYVLCAYCACPNTLQDQKKTCKPDQGVSSFWWTETRTKCKEYFITCEDATTNCDEVRKVDFLINDKAAERIKNPQYAEHVC